MEELVSIVRRVNEEVYDEVSSSTRLGYCLHDKKMIIYSTINICEEHSLRKAEKFIKEFNQDSSIMVNFKREYINLRGSQETYKGPIFYIKNVELKKEEISTAANTLKKILEDFYNSL